MSFLNYRVLVRLRAKCSEVRSPKLFDTIQTSVVRSLADSRVGARVGYKWIVAFHVKLSSEASGFSSDGRVT